MVKKTILRRLEALEKTERTRSEGVSMVVDYNKLFNLEGKDAEPENVIKYLFKIDEDGHYHLSGSVIADPFEC
jgi:hypothetical protein